MLSSMINNSLNTVEGLIARKSLIELVEEELRRYLHKDSDTAASVSLFLNNKILVSFWIVFFNNNSK